MSHVPVPIPPSHTAGERAAAAMAATASSDLTRVAASARGQDAAALAPLAPIRALTEVAERALGVPLALVALPSDPTSGAAGPAAIAAAPGDPCFAEHDPTGAALLAEVEQLDGPLLIEDIRSAAPLRGIPVVRAARVMAVLAVPLRDGEGRVSGALCALDGVPRWWSDRDIALLEPLALALGALLHGGGRRSGGRVEAARDRRRAEAAVEHSTLEALSQLPDGLVLLEPSGALRWANPAAARLLSLTSGDGATVPSELSNAIDQTVAAAWRRAQTSGAAVTTTWRHPRTQRWLEAHAAPTTSGLAIAVRDISDSRRSQALQEQRELAGREAYALQAVGQLAGGVAHDFNNLLTIISANAELLRQLEPIEDCSQRELDEIERATRHASTLTRQLLAFAQLLPLDPVDIDLHTQLGTLEATLRAALPAGVILESEIAVERAIVRADELLLGEVLLALASNAGEAMPEGGALRLQLSRCVLARALPAVPEPIPGGDWLVLALHDTGTGISPEHLTRLFEPFFTTKGVGRGKGLGLAAVHGIVRQLGGRCSVSSELGRGTSMHVWLPDATRRTTQTAGRTTAA